MAHGGSKEPTRSRERSASRMVGLPGPEAWRAALLRVFRFQSIGINCASRGLLLAALISGTPVLIQAQNGEAVFRDNCSACHTIGGGELLGPDLKGITDRRDSDWLEQYVKDPEEMVARGDALAVQLLKEYAGVPMPDMGLSAAEVKAVLAYVEAQSSGGGSMAPEKPVPMGDASVGQSLFTGALPFENGGTSCMACHSVAGVGALGGGNMGPDLTHVFRKYGDIGLSSALGSSPFPTMKPLYAARRLTEEEQGHLMAFFAEVDQQQVQDAGRATAWIWGISGLVVVLLFGIMLVFRPRKEESVSEWLRRKA